MARTFITDSPTTLDLFCDARDDVRVVLDACTEQSKVLGGNLQLIRDGGTFMRARLSFPEHAVVVDVAHEPSTPLAPRETIDGVVV